MGKKSKKKNMDANYLWLLILCLAIGATTIILKSKPALAKETVPQPESGFYNIKINSISGQALDLNQLRGKVVLVVNVASQCGFTKQYEGLEKLYQKYKDKGLVILGVPSNDFGNQEPGTESDIQTFCQVNYGVTFPLTQKVSIKGDKQHELYTFLTQNNPKHSGAVKWNFSKFLLDQNGHVIDRFSSMTKPRSRKIVNQISSALDA